MPLQPEQIEHINVVNWFNHNFPELADDFHHFANERRCSIQQGKLLKRMGVKKGVSDFFLALPVPENKSSGLWIELKVGKNKPTKEQSDFLERKTTRGYQCALVWGAEAAKEIIMNYLKYYAFNKDNNKTNYMFNNKPIC